ncbi:MAG: LPD29 domain-containing protein [Specibacter sp.]
MSIYISATDTAKLVRKALKENFPGTKFSVRTTKYAGGASLDVNWTGGPTTPKVDAVVKGFEGSEPDASGDFCDPVIHEKDGQRIQYGARHILTMRMITQATYDTIQTEVLASMSMASTEVQNWNSYPVPQIVLQRAEHFRYAQGTVHDFVRAIADSQDAGPN